MGKRKGDIVNGVLLLDKPQGMTSNFALQQCRRLFNAQKAGHTGTLDPMATGLLPLCFGEATKFSADLLEADKEYVATLKLGQTTDTADAEGQVLQTRPVTVTADTFTTVLESFKGEITQVPPMYSALKKDGVALYKLARAGQTVEREARKVVISRLELLEFKNEEATIRVACSKGTYIRVLAEDIGEKLGCGAHLVMLRRTRVGAIVLCDAVTLDDFAAVNPTDRQKMLLPVDALISSLPIVELNSEMSLRFRNGQRLAIGCSNEGRVRVYGLLAKGRILLGTAQVDSTGVVAPERLISTED